MVNNEAILVNAINKALDLKIKKEYIAFETTMGDKK